MPERIFKPFGSIAASIGSAVAAFTLQDVSTLVSIAAGLASFYYTFRCIRKLDTDKKNKTNQPAGGSQPPAESVNADYK